MSTEIRILVLKLYYFQYFWGVFVYSDDSLNFMRYILTDICYIHITDHGSVVLIKK